MINNCRLQFKLVWTKSKFDIIKNITKDIYIPAIIGGEESRVQGL